MTEDQIREEFEAWYLEDQGALDGVLERHFGGSYKDAHTDAAWCGYFAAREKNDTTRST